MSYYVIPSDNTLFWSQAIVCPREMRLSAASSSDKSTPPACLSSLLHFTDVCSQIIVTEVKNESPESTLHM